MPPKRRPTGTSCPRGRSSPNSVRYHVTPGASVAGGRPHPRSAVFGSGQPARSPCSPPLFRGPRNGSGLLPCNRHVTGGGSVVPVPTSSAPTRPRGCLNRLSSTVQSSLWPMFSTSTESTAGVPGASPGRGNVPGPGRGLTGASASACTPPRAQPRYLPLSHTWYTPFLPVIAFSDTAVSPPVAVNLPWYQTCP